LWVRAYYQVSHGDKKGDKMAFRDQLEELYACSEALKWVGNKSLEEAWKTCKNPDWMLWVLTKTNLDLIDPICDMAEEVLHLVPEDRKLACIWAISAARRRASKDELTAASTAAYAASFGYGAINLPAAAAAYAAEYYGAANTVSLCTSSASADKNDEKNKQCDILRKYFTIDQVSEAFNKLVVQLSYWVRA
jgi:hypothetical protein